MTQPVIDRAGAADIELLLPLLEALFSLEADFSFDPDKARRALLLLVNDSERSCVLVARAEQKIIGMCSAQLVFSTAQGAPSAWVEDVVVAQAYRGTGIGQRLLSELEQWCQRLGATRLQLVADRDNHPALDFYRHNGWDGSNLTVLKKIINTDR